MPVGQIVGRMNAERPVADPDRRARHLSFGVHGRTSRQASVTDAFDSAQLGPITLRNRFIKAATFEGRTPDALVTEDLIDFHREMAAGGVGMTTVAYCAVARRVEPTATSSTGAPRHLDRGFAAPDRCGAWRGRRDLGTDRPRWPGRQPAQHRCPHPGAQPDVSAAGHAVL